tara:strand:- start:5653 stop:6855 length:1203 start_codon:yes stop_codon:yes gene_type:complete
LFYSKFNSINVLKNFLLIISLVLFCTVLINEPRSVTKNDALIHCEITNILTFNNLDPYLEKNIEKVYPKIFPVEIEKIGTNYLPLVIKSFKLLCHPYINWVENYKYFLTIVPIIFLFFNFKNSSASIVLLLTGFNGFYQAFRSGNISIVAQLILVLFFISLFRKKVVLSSLLLTLLVYIKVTLLPIYIVLLIAIKNEEVKKIIKFSIPTLLSLIYITYLLEGEIFKTWINYYNIFSSSETVNSFNVINDIFGNYYDTPSVPNLLFYLYQSNLLIFFTVLFLVLIFCVLLLNNLRKNNAPIEHIFIDIFILYFILNPYLRTYHLIEIAILLAFYVKDRNSKSIIVISLFCVIPQITLLEIGTEMLGSGYILLVSLYPPLVFSIYIFTDKLKNKKINLTFTK